MATIVREKPDREPFDWTPEEEVQLFFAMEGVKPVGVNRHFYMACITERLCKALQREITSDAIWSHLRSMYNLKVLDKQEYAPFLNEECDFGLPEADFGTAILRRKQEDTERIVPAWMTGETEAKHVEIKSDQPVLKVSATKIPVAAKDSKETEREEGPMDGKDTREHPPSSGKIKIKGTDSNGAEGGAKRAQKRTRGSMSIEPVHSTTTSPANTPPNGPSTKRRRI
ncbi:MRG/MORF4L-binding protein [Anopheles cruzii]|uniref:MRG/MORF4L-binding protein n=1 Tax=Anopheles cruzii TaxID=68878 RepID=UPI0022EC502A|nr:MRG/MORF4L-binding protein [Anopheles cruzii]